MPNLHAHLRKAVHRLRQLQSGYQDIERAGQEVQLRQSEQSLRITLESMGDGVISTDQNEKVTFLNPAAQELTGWTLEEAVGNPFAQVFRIYNSLTGEPAENIVSRVLQTKDKVNLANHTVLISKDGTHRHISDSAAPVRGLQGEILGVVLIFSDITEQYQLQQKLLDSEARSKAALQLARLGTWELEVNTRNFLISPECCDIFGLPHSKDYGHDALERLVHPEDREIVTGIYTKALQGDEQSFQIQNRIFRKSDDALRNLKTYVSVERDEVGNLHKIIGVVQDITEELKVGKRIQESEELYRTAFEKSVIGQAHVELDGRFLRVNDTLCKILGYRPEDMIAHSILEFAHPTEKISLQESKQRILTQGITTVATPRQFLRKDGRIAWLSVSSLLVKNSDGEPLYILSSLIDITARHQAEMELIQSERRLRRAQAQAHSGNWEIDLETMKMWASDEAFRIYGYEIAENNILPLQIPQNAVISSQRKMLDEALELLLTKDIPYDIEFSIQRINDGKMRALHSQAIVERDEENRPRRVLGVLQDITDRRRLEEEYRRALATTMDGFLLYDQSFHILQVNEAFCNLLGYSWGELTGKPVEEIEADLNLLKQRRDVVLNVGADRFETQMIRKNGEKVIVEISLSYIPGSDTFCAFVRDITERKHREEHIRFLSYHDVLTGLYNRTFFERECLRLEEQQIFPVTIVMGDINGLKLTNDVFGHMQGDKLLTAIAEIFRRNLRSDDIAARIGGDEFCLLLPYTTSEEAKVFCEKIQADCDREIIRFEDGNSVSLSIAIGHATRWSDEDGFHDTFKLAEDVMYKQKLLEHKSMHSTLITSIRATMYEKSHETREHADRLIDMACRLGRRMGLDDSQISDLELLGALHDLGKIGVPEQILDKPGPLTDLEWVQMRRHPEIGYRIAQASPELSAVADGILCHHERWDGEGYPQGLKEANIPLLARILSVVDSYDAMTSRRVYHDPISSEQALEEIRRCAGSQFDPQIADLFLEMMKDGSYSHAVY